MVDFKTRIGNLLKTGQSTGNGNPFGGIIDFSKGRFEFMGPIGLPCGTQIEGDGLATTLVNLNPDPNLPAFYPIGEDIGGYIHNDFVRISDLYVQTPGAVIGCVEQREIVLGNWEVRNVKSRTGYDFDERFCYLQRCYFHRVSMHYDGGWKKPMLSFRGNMNVFDQLESFQRGLNVSTTAEFVIRNGYGNVFYSCHCEGHSAPFRMWDITGDYNQIYGQWMETGWNAPNRDNIQLILDDASETLFDHVFARPLNKLVIRKSQGVLIHNFSAYGLGFETIGESIDIDEASSLTIINARVQVPDTNFPPNIKVINLIKR